MLEAKNIQTLKGENVLETHLHIIDIIKSETLNKVGTFLSRFGIYFNYDLISFLNNPIGYPGIPYKLPLVVNKFLIDSISFHYFEIQKANLQIKVVNEIILNQIFRGKK